MSNFYFYLKVKPFIGQWLVHHYGKRVISYNYMSKHAMEALEEIIDDTFKMQMWKDLNEMTRRGCTLLKSVRAWCERNGIDTDYDYTLKMRYQRMRDSYLRHGVDLRKK